MRPSPHVWSQIEKRIGANGSARKTTPPRQRVAPWQAIAASVALLAVLVGGFFTYRSVVGPDLLALATVTAPNATESSWILSADADLRHLRARAGGGLKQAACQDSGERRASVCHTSPPAGQPATMTSNGAWFVRRMQIIRSPLSLLLRKTRLRPTSASGVRTQG